MLTITYQESIEARNLSALKGKLERRPYSWGDPCLCAGKLNRPWNVHYLQIQTYICIPERCLGPLQPAIACLPSCHPSPKASWIQPLQPPLVVMTYEVGQTHTTTCFQEDKNSYTIISFFLKS